MLTKRERESTQIKEKVLTKGGLPGDSRGKESTCTAGNLGSIPGLGKSPGGGHGSPLQYSCLENPHGQRSLAGYSPWGRKESDTTAWPSTQHMPKLIEKTDREGNLTKKKRREICWDSGLEWTRREWAHSSRKEVRMWTLQKRSRASSGVQTGGQANLLVSKGEFSSIGFYLSMKYRGRKSSASENVQHRWEKMLEIWKEKKKQREWRNTIWWSQHK